MTPLQSRIMDRLRGSRYVQTAAELAEALREPREDVTEALHGLQDTSDVLMRNGFYRASPLHWARYGVRG
jgi:hypothetical protein